MKHSTLLDTFNLKLWIWHWSINKKVFFNLVSLCVSLNRSKLIDAVSSEYLRVTQYIYRPQRSWGKVMFLQASVILLTGGSTSCPPGADTPREQTPPRADPPEQTPPQSRHPLGLSTPPQQACCEIRSMRGRYASYWNAILSNLVLQVGNG